METVSAASAYLSRVIFSIRVTPPPYSQTRSTIFSSDDSDRLSRPFAARISPRRLRRSHCDRHSRGRSRNLSRGNNKRHSRGNLLGIRLAVSCETARDRVGRSTLALRRSFDFHVFKITFHAFASVVKRMTSVLRRAIARLHGKSAPLIAHRPVLAVLRPVLAACSNSISNKRNSLCIRRTPCSRPRTISTPRRTNKRAL